MSDSNSKAGPEGHQDLVRGVNVAEEENEKTTNGEALSPPLIVPNVFPLVQTLLQNIQPPTAEGETEDLQKDAVVITPYSSPEDMLVKTSSIFGQLKEAINQMNQTPEMANVEIPTASLPSFFVGASRPKSDGPTYKPADYNAVNLLEMGGQTTKMLESITDGIVANIMGSVVAPIGTSSPQSTFPYSAIMNAISTPPTLPSQIDNATGHKTPLPPQFDSMLKALLNDAIRAFQTDEKLLHASIDKLTQDILTLPEGDGSYPFLLSEMGRNCLHLYEVILDDDFFDIGLDGTANAMNILRQLPGFLRAESAPTIICSWAYGQRLLVQKEGDDDRLHYILMALKSCWDRYKDLEALDPRVKTSLRAELGVCLLDQYRSTGCLDDLNSSIEHLGALKGEYSSEAPVAITLGMAYYDRFLHCGDTDDLDRALHQGQQACSTGIETPISTRMNSLTPTYNAGNAAGHHLFALGLAERFKMTLDVRDLDKAVKQCQKAIDHLHPSHPLLPLYKSSLACILYARYEATKEPEDIQSALEVIQSAAHGSKDIPGRHLGVPREAIQGYLVVMNLGAETANISAIEDGIRVISKSRKAFSGAAHIESRVESYISKCLLYLYRIGDKQDDFDSALHHATLAFEKAPEESPYRYQFGLDMGRLLFEQYQTGHSTNCDEAIAQFCTIALSSTWPSIRLDAAIQWANAVEALDTAAALDALNVGLDILPSLASLGERMSTQYKILSLQKSTIPERAASYALDTGDMMTAVSCLEKGRNIMWAQALQLRAGHMLPSGDERQHEFKLLSKHLLYQRQELTQKPEQVEEMVRHLPPDYVNHNPLLGLMKSSMDIFSQVTRRMAEINGTESVNRYIANHQEFRDNYMSVYMDGSLHNSAKRWNTLLSEFVELKGALSFNPSVQRDLVPILNNGYIVIVNTYSFRCDAIVISAQAGDLDFQHIPLPDMSGDKIHTWAEKLRRGMHILGGEKTTIPEYESDFLIPVLRGLWKGLACPLLDHFTRSGNTKRRVWWYPTGPLMFLPLHAASPCEGNKDGLLDLFISSYIPSIHSLIRASQSPPLPLKVLAVGQPETPGHAPLPYAGKDISALKRQFRENPDSLTTLIGEEAKIYPVISSLLDHTALHLSCHAMQDEMYPFNSAFYFHNGPLRLSKIMGLDLSRVQFAFLSACLTSAGDTGLPNECIHLAAGMQFAGVGSVIATMWSVEDRISAAMSSQVYSHLLRNGVERADTRESAEALHKAIKAVKKARTPLTYIVPFIHLGI